MLYRIIAGMKWKDACKTLALRMIHSERSVLASSSSSRGSSSSNSSSSSRSIYLVYPQSDP